MKGKKIINLLLVTFIFPKHISVSAEEKNWRSDLVNFLYEFPTMYLLSAEYSYPESSAGLFSLEIGGETILPSSFSLHDFDNDDIPEAIIHYSSLGTSGGICVAYQYPNGQYEKLGETSYLGDYYKDKDGRLVLYENSDIEGVYRFSYLSINDGAIFVMPPFISFQHDSMGDGLYDLDGKKLYS